MDCKDFLTVFFVRYFMWSFWSLFIGSICPLPRVRLSGWVARSREYLKIPQLPNAPAKEMVYPVITARKVGFKIPCNHIGVILRLQVYKQLMFPAFIYPYLRHSVNYVRYLLSLNTWMDRSCCKLESLEETSEHAQNIIQAIRAFHFGIYPRHNMGKSVEIKMNLYHLLKCVRGSAPALLPLLSSVSVFASVSVSASASVKGVRGYIGWD